MGNKKNQRRPRKRRGNKKSKSPSQGNPNKRAKHQDYGNEEIKEPYGFRSPLSEIKSSCDESSPQMQPRYELYFGRDEKVPARFHEDYEQTVLCTRETNMRNRSRPYKQNESKVASFEEAQTPENKENENNQCGVPLLYRARAQNLRNIVSHSTFLNGRASCYPNENSNFVSPSRKQFWEAYCPVNHFQEVRKPRLLENEFGNMFELDRVSYPSLPGELVCSEELENSEVIPKDPNSDSSLTKDPGSPKDEPTCLQEEILKYYTRF